MRSQNRPFNAVMLHQNLHGEVGKTQCVKILAELAKAKKLVEGVFGKQKIYWINQEGLEEASPEEIKELDQKINEMKEELTETEQEIAKITNENRQLENALTDEDLEKELQNFEAINKKMFEKLENLRNSDIKVDPKQRENSMKQWENLRVKKFFFSICFFFFYTFLAFHQKIWRVRKRTCIESLKDIQANVPEKLDLEELGIETDEEVKIDPNFSFVEEFQKSLN